MPPETGLSSFLKQHYLQRVDIPREILLTALPDEAELLEQYLTGRAGRRVHLRVPQRGDARRVLELAERNADQSLERVADREEKVRRSVAELAALTGLDTPPRRIEAIDISNTSGSEVVGGIVVFVDGRPSKKDYKRYKIKTVEGQDDYESMREVVWRRLRRFQKGDVGFEQLPDLLLLDGGKGQLSAVKEVLEELGVTLPVFGMVKDDRHRTRGLVGRAARSRRGPSAPPLCCWRKFKRRCTATPSPTTVRCAAKRPSLRSLPASRALARRAPPPCSPSSKRLTPSKTPRSRSLPPCPA